jgi:hypothetical protein
VFLNEHSTASFGFVVSILINFGVVAVCTWFDRRRSKSQEIGSPMP